MKIKINFRFRPLLALFLSLNISCSAFAFTTKDARTAIGAHTSALYFQRGTNGYFKANQIGGVAFFHGT